MEQVLIRHHDEGRNNRRGRDKNEDNLLSDNNVLRPFDFTQDRVTCCVWLLVTGGMSQFMTVFIFVTMTMIMFVMVIIWARQA